MASFSICPLIDQKCFLGITNDDTPGCIIVSLGKKIIIRFRLADQKQLCCWTTKEKLTTPVNYDADRKEYFAIFNGELISRWPKDKEYIFKRIAKYKLPWLIHSIFCFSGMRPVLLFQCGTVALLGTDNKKSVTVVKENVFPDGDVVKATGCSILGGHYICILVKNDEELYLKCLPLTGSDENEFTLKVKRKESSATLNCFTFIEEKNQLMSLWSDGFLYSFDCDESARNFEEFPGKCLMTFTNINCSLPCVMLALENHVAVYGADANGEGAKIVWVEATFGVIQNSLHLKIYSNPPRMWKVGSTYLITPVGQNLMVIPYQLKNTPKLDSLIAAHCHNEPASIIQHTWEKRKREKNLLLALINSDLNESVNKDFPQNVLSPEITNKLLEQGKIKEAINNLSNFCDLTDRCVIDAVICCLDPKRKHLKENLLQVLSLPLLSDNETVSYVRDKLGFESAIALLEIITEQIRKEPENESLYKWLALLLDSHYQQYLLSKDEAVVNHLENVKNRLNDLIKDMVNLQELYKLLTGTLKSKLTTNSSVHYSVDKFRLF